MNGSLFIIALGFLLGMRHATDPDHVIAVSTIVARHRSVSGATLIGGLWGVGHTVTILIVGGGIILFGWVIPVRIGLSMEFSVGLMLILLGIFNLTGVLNWIAANLLPFHDHTSDLPHAHTRASDPSAAPLKSFDRNGGSIGAYHAIRPLIVGLIHGLAGSAAVALLVLTTIRSPKWAVAYLGLFGLGTIAGMMLITGTLVLPLRFWKAHSSRLDSGLRFASGLISLGFGLFLTYQIGFIDGLFRASPHWIPR